MFIFVNKSLLTLEKSIDEWLFMLSKVHPMSILSSHARWRIAILVKHTLLGLQVFIGLWIEGRVGEHLLEVFKLSRVNVLPAKWTLLSILISLKLNGSIARWVTLMALGSLLDVRDRLFGGRLSIGLIASIASISLVVGGLYHFISLEIPLLI